MKNVVQEALTLARHRLVLFKEVARCAQECETTVELRPAEFWEAGDQLALDRIDLAIRTLNGETPLFDLQEAP